MNKYSPRIQILINTARKYDKMANVERKEGRTKMDCIDRAEAFYLRKMARNKVMEK